jgi:hypothetical protein
MPCSESLRETPLGEPHDPATKRGCAPFDLLPGNRPSPAPCLPILQPATENSRAGIAIILVMRRIVAIPAPASSRLAMAAAASLKPQNQLRWGRAYVKSRDPCDVAFSPAIVPGHRVLPKCKFSSRCWQKGLLKTNMDPEATASAVLSTSPSVSRTCDLQQLPPFYRPPPATASAVLSTSPSVSRTCDLRFNPTRVCVSTTGAE